jgi:hypothetical protein
MEVKFADEQTSRGKLQRLLLPQGGPVRPPPGLPLSNVQAREATYSAAAAAASARSPSGLSGGLT